MQTVLPDKYYLAHAQEIFDFSRHQCAHLLGDAEHEYLNRYDQLSGEAQCLLIRILSRKPRFLKISSLAYAEINNLGDALKELKNAGFVSHVLNDDWHQFLPTLTKPQLIACLDATRAQFKASSAKPVLLSLAQVHCIANTNNSLCQEYVVRRKQTHIDYILFLFFGDLRNRLQKFAMRDLGVLKTRSSSQNKVARFEHQDEARNVYDLQRLRQRFESNPTQLRENTARYLIEAQPLGHLAQELTDKLLLAVGNEFSGDDSELAIRLWQQSNDPKASERWIRECYQSGDRDELKLALEDLRAQQLAPETSIFVEDFYSRKYLGKRTSIYTDLLREKSRCIPVDEVFVNQVEEGVIRHYRQHGAEAHFVENKLWRALFAFTFWPLLFGRDQQRGSEFDRLPLCLKDNTFYQKFSQQIESRLAMLDDPEDAFSRFTTLAARHYGYPTGLFRWNANLLDSLSPCLRFAPSGSLAKVLRGMAKNYKHCKDGYPDLMVIENGALRFEEIKAPGDVLRPNQLVSMNRLRQAGLAIELTQVEWTTDPNQCYAVVDIETTGGRQSGNSITEIAVVKVQNSEIVSQWSSLIKPSQRIPAHITHLTGIDNQMVARAPLFAEIADELEEQLRDCIFVAHNVGFDYGFIKAAYEAINRSFRKPKYCTVRNTRKTFPGLQSYSLGNLCAHFDIDLHNHHRALSDAMATAHLLRLIQDKTMRESMPIE